MDDTLQTPMHNDGDAPTAAATALDAQRFEAARLGLAHGVERWTDGSQVFQPAALPSLSMYRTGNPVGPICGLYQPSVGLIVQGRKRVLLGGDAFTYDPRHFLVTALNVPTVANILDATPQCPFMALLMTLDPHEINRMVLEGKLPPARGQGNERAMTVGSVHVPLLRAFQRLVDLLDEPESIPVLAPLVQQEILYWLLVSDQGARLRQIGAVGSSGHQIARAIDLLKSRFTEPLRIEALADEARMSLSTFHHHFKQLTAMSPLQYRKRLQLNEARRLMFAEHLDASTAAYRVGYESASQFSREYSREFGSPPGRDMVLLREAALNAAMGSAAQGCARQGGAGAAH
ncbi:AraC family transcriptional regulator [Azohydromonas lata]|uniref:AraC family transcriptional regulator n=1 Tax=Azohydromonas lata TaxID=45677 RepID=UPI000AE3E214|nr:AraC family transcriptional regulator [Azohydromonas lata]